MSTAIIALLFAFLVGSIIGSFLNVLIVRIPKGENIAYPASHCPTCGHPLRWRHNIPIVSWIMLKGRCAFCQSSISRTYPVIEFMTGLLYATTALKTGLNAEWFVVSTVFALLLALSVIDFRYYAVPDSLNITALALALLLPLFDLGREMLTSQTVSWEHYETALLRRFEDAVILALSFFLLGQGVRWIVKKDALGEADIIIAATMGALLGFPLALIALYIAALLAIGPALFARGHMVPFVPFLAMGTWITWLFDQSILAWWSHLYG